MSGSFTGCFRLATPAWLAPGNREAHGKATWCEAIRAGWLSGGQGVNGRFSA